jgi:1-acyl-sn-glycerol-3-phosphate acyltransferase
MDFKETKKIKVFYWFLKKTVGPIVKLIWVKKISGLKNIPKNKACLIVANHSSYFDFISLATISPRNIFYLAAEKFFENIFWKFFVKNTGQIYVDRKNKDKSQVYKIIYSALSQEKVVGIFPEGTRSRNGKIQKAYNGVSKFALIAKVPVIPVGIIGAYEILSPEKKIPKFKKIIEINIAEPMYFNDFYGKENDEKVLKEITNKIMLKIAELSNQKYLYAK